MNVARDENQAPLFTPGDLAVLRNSLLGKVVDALMLQILGVNEDDEDEEVGKSPQNP